MSINFCVCSVCTQLPIFHESSLPVHCWYFLSPSFMNHFFQDLAGVFSPSFMNHFYSCDQAALWIVQSVCLCLSVRLSVCLSEWFSSSVSRSVGLSVTPFSLCSLHGIIIKFSVITIDRIDVHAKGQHQRSKVKVTEVKTQLSRLRTVTPVWIHIWQWNDAQSLMWHSRGALLLFKVIH